MMNVREPLGITLGKKKQKTKKTYKCMHTNSVHMHKTSNQSEQKSPCRFLKELKELKNLGNQAF